MACILIAEDDPHISRVIALWLRRQGHEVLTASSGPAALEELRAHRPDLLVTDVNMPGMSGLELLAAARDGGLLTRPAIVLTSRCDQRQIAEQASGMQAVVFPKPFSPAQLTRTIDEILGSSVDEPRPLPIDALGGRPA